MNVLIIEEDSEALQAVRIAVEKQFPSASTTFLTNITEGIKALEKYDVQYDLIVFGYRGLDHDLVRRMISLSAKTALIMMSPDQTHLKSFADVSILESAIHSELPDSLSIAAQRLLTKGLLRDANTEDEEFVPMKPSVLSGVSPVRVDIYLRLGKNRFVRIFRKGEEFESGDIEKYCSEKKIDTLYIRKAQNSELLQNTQNNLESLITKKNLTEDQADTAVSASLEAMRSMVERAGFTPEAQSIAKSSVALTLKVLGTRPKLESILSRMQKDDGKYITSHSLMLGKVACALAFRIQWNSAATYLKLTLASFLHDLPLRDNKLAAFDSLVDAQRSKLFKDSDLHHYKLHPMAAAEYARQFNEIPGDVDTILMQHHEKPDGTGFPRGLSAKQISPLSCLFIVAHDLLHYTTSQPQNADLSLFFKQNETKYSTGNFRKIFTQLKSENR